MDALGLNFWGADWCEGGRLGDQDLESIVELLRRQNCSQEAWLEAVGEQEDRVRGMEEEMAELKKQKLAMAGVFSNPCRAIHVPVHIHADPLTNSHQ